ncbi:hypothetical protein ACTXJR_06035 [Glutamicibacter ardleyensis]|uniref:hypothetical protein n=1 Tax=Glutamicibacter ardleyensis TaxID=225894 RepID=UPI003FD1A7F6
MKRLAPLALIAALALTGCAPKALEVAPGPSHVPAGAPVAVSVAESQSAPSAQTAVESSEAKGSQKRADMIMDLFLKSYDRTDFKQFTIDTPHRAIKEWYLKADNESFVIVLDNESSTYWLANDFLTRVHEQGEISKVTVLDKNSYGASRVLSDLDLG